LQIQLNKVQLQKMLYSEMVCALDIILESYQRGFNRSSGWPHHTWNSVTHLVNASPEHCSIVDLRGDGETLFELGSFPTYWYLTRADHLRFVREVIGVLILGQRSQGSPT